jgi:hypothetical protein
MTTLVFRMTSGAEHEVTLPTDQADALAEEVARRWKGKIGPAPSLIRTDGTSVVINPEYVESVVRR